MMPQDPDNLPPASSPLPNPSPRVSNLMPEDPKISRLFVAGTVAGFIVLLVAVIVLSIAVIRKNAADNMTTTGSTDRLVTATKTVVATHSTKNENIDFLLYTPRQTANNTTIDFALKNTCEKNCPVKSYAPEPYAPSHTGKDLADTYLIDESAEEKYTVITDTRDKSLISPECYGNLKPGQKIDCFASFAKVPSGSTVSLVTRDFRIDSILIP